MKTLFNWMNIFGLAIGAWGCATKGSAEIARAVNAIIDQMPVPTSLSALSADAREVVSGCSTTGDISAFTHTCTFSTDTAVTCAANSLTWSAGTVTLSAVRPQDALYTVTTTISASLTGGEIEGTQIIACTFSADYTLNSTTGFLKTNPVLDNCTDFTCTIGGEALTCEDMKSVIAADPCSSTS